MSNIEFWDPEIVIIWGCKPSQQYGRDWLLHLLRPCWVKEINWFDSFELEPFHIHKNALVILIESGIYLLESNINRKDLEVYNDYRLQRINHLRHLPNFIIWHMSDDQGLDGNYFYTKIAKDIRIYREFQCDQFSLLNNIRNVPLGPSRWALKDNPWLNSSERKYSWSFIGTDWSNNSRKEAVKFFTENIPGGFSSLGSNFGSGMSSNKYIENTLNSSFIPCPKGNFHFETIRFYEALELGAIPMVIKGSETFLKIFKDNFPLPIFRDWEEAAKFSMSKLNYHDELNRLQLLVYQWWLNEKNHLSSEISSLSNATKHDWR